MHSTLNLILHSEVESAASEENKTAKPFKYFQGGKQRD